MASLHSLTLTLATTLLLLFTLLSSSALSTTPLQPCSTTVSNMNDLKTAMIINTNSVLCINPGVYETISTLQIVRSQNIVLQGMGATPSDTIISYTGFPGNRLIALTNPLNSVFANFTIINLTVRGGYHSAPGACIHMRGSESTSLSIYDSIIQDCVSYNPNGGGGCLAMVTVNGILNVNNVIFRRCVSSE